MSDEQTPVKLPRWSAPVRMILRQRSANLWELVKPTWLEHGDLCIVFCEDWTDASDWLAYRITQSKKEGGLRFDRLQGNAGQELYDHYRAWYWELHPENEEISRRQVMEGLRKAREAPDTKL